MVLAVISLIALLSSVESYWLPFTAFPGSPVTVVPGYGYAQGRVPPGQTSLHKVFPYPTYAQYSLVPSTGYQTFSQSIGSNQAFQRNPFNFGKRNFVQGRIPSNEFTTGNIVENAKAQAESTLTILESFKGSSIAAQYINPIFDTSDCLNNLEDVTNLIREGTSLIVENGPEIIYLEAIVESLKGETDIIKMTKASSRMLRTLDGLGPSLATATSNLCISSPEASVKSFRELSHVLVHISNNRNLIVPLKSKELLEISAEIMDQTANFLETLNRSLETFQTVCQNGSNNQTDIYDSIRKILKSLAGLFEKMGFEEKSAEILKQSEFIKKFVDNYAGLEDLDLDLECSLVGDYATLAQTLDDLAEIIELVGVETLSKELGINLDFQSL